MSPTTVYEVREGRKFNTDDTLVVVRCWTCKILYAIPASLRQAARDYPGEGRDGWKLCCPLGHTWWYTGRSVEQELADERGRASRLRAELDQTEAALRAQKARGTRFKNDRDRERRRAAAGVCPCCNRTFKQLRRHMTSQHPEFPEPE